MPKRHWETGLYGYATALVTGTWSADNLAAYRLKMVSKHGNTQGEILLVERNPQVFINKGWQGLVAWSMRDNVNYN